MNKITILTLFMSVFFGQAQINTYKFSQSNGTYTEIGGTSLGDETSDEKDFLDPGIPLGGDINTGPGFDFFNFTFNNTVYNRFGVSDNGWIALGTTNLSPAVNMQTSSNPYTPLSSIITISQDVQDVRISALGSNLMAQTGATLQYEIIGISPYRTLVVQWKNYKRVGATGESFNFQIRLNETYNTINFIYGNFTAIDASGAGYQVGLRTSPTTTLVANYTNRTSLSGWNNTSAGISATDVVKMENNDSIPVKGLMYTWTPPSCGVATGVTISNISSTGAVFSWTTIPQAPASGYEYLVSNSPTAPSVTDNGITTTNLTATTTNLSPSTNYYIFFRSNCGNEKTQWALGGIFRTPCIALNSFSENFDSTSQNTLPNCWSKGTIGSGNAYVYVNSIEPATPPNRLVLYGDPSTSPQSVAYVLTPDLANLQNSTNRLRFKAYGGGTGKAIDVGYFTDKNNLSSYVNIFTFDNLPATPLVAKEYTIAPIDIPIGIKNLVFRVIGQTSGTYVYVDDVFWETDPACKDITNLNASITNSNSVNISWNDSPSTTKTQYVFSSNLGDDPNALNPYDITTNSITLNLTPGTTYKVWVRSKCSNNFGSWISTTFTTPCIPVDSFIQNFDSVTTLPSCWSKIGDQGTAIIQKTSLSITQPNALLIQSSLTYGTATIVLPAVNNAGAGTHRLRFKNAVFSENKTLEVGYVTDANNASSFVSIQSFNITKANVFYENIAILGNKPTSPFLAFRVNNTDQNTIMIDDVVWEPLPVCQDVQNISAVSINNNSIGLNWDTIDSNTTFQYAIGSASLSDASTLTPNVVNNNSVTITQLNSTTPYKVWVRSVCHNSSFGSWMGPLMFTTTCDPVESFNENFDNNLSFPNCWGNDNTSSTVINSATISTSQPNLLSLNSSATSLAIVAMRPVKPTPLGSYNLKFKFRSFKADATLEVGYLKIPSDANSFQLLKSFSPNVSNSMVSVVTQVGITLESQVLAFRNKGVPASTIYIDDVVWEPVPTCTDVENLTNLGVTDNTLNLEWTEGGQEIAWQYALGTNIVTDPNTLTPKDVNSSSIQVVGLNASASYKIWVRSKCDSSNFGKWVGPLNFSTTCVALDYLHENFDNSTDIPVCWTRPGTSGTVQITNSTYNLPTLPNSLFLYSGSENSKAIIAMPLLSNTNNNTHRLRFKTKGSTIGANLEVGYMTNSNDANSFIPLKVFTTATTSDFENRIALLGSDPNSQILAFRNSGNPSSTINIDDVYWETIPTCQDVKNISVTAISLDNATLFWDMGNSTNFQYALGQSSDSDPNALILKDVSLNTLNISQLSHATTYRVWIRSKCSDTAFGVWIGPISFTTNCDPVSEFSENFDSGTSLPACWNKSGTLGGAYVNNNLNTPSGSNSLVIFSDSVSGQGIIALPALNNAGSGTHRLSFKAKSNIVNSRLEVGYLNNIADPNSFIVLQVVTILSNTSFNDYFVKFTDIQPQSQTLALRNSGTESTYIYLDDVAWQLIPQCGDVINPHVILVNNNSADISWNQNVPNNNWQYALGDSSATNPNTIAAINAINNYISINGLAPSKSYKIWIRSMCSDTNLGYWVGPLVFETTCDPVTTFTENFNNSTSIPTCWKKCGDKGSITINSNASNPIELNTLNIFSGTSLNQGIIAMPPVSNASDGTQKLKFKAKTDTANTILEIGYLKDITDSNSFVSLQTKTIVSTTNFTDYMIDLGTTPQSEVLAFRNSGNLTSTIYVDNVIWDETILGIEEMDSNNFSFFPNPVKSILNISYNQNITSVKIFNLLGQLVVAKEMNTTETSLDMSSLSSGAYLIKVTSQSQVKNLKIIKE